MLVAATNEKVSVVAGPAGTGFAAVTINGEPLAVGASTTTATVSRLSTHELILRAGSFVVEVECIDGFVNLRSVSVSTSVKQSQLSAHGLLGQTWNNKRHASTLKVIEGEVDDYVVAEDTVFGTMFVYNKFSVTQ